MLLDAAFNICFGINLHNVMDKETNKPISIRFFIFHHNQMHNLLET